MKKIELKIEDLYSWDSSFETPTIEQIRLAWKSIHETGRLTEEEVRRAFTFDFTPRTTLFPRIEDRRFRIIDRLQERYEADPVVNEELELRDD
jgi:hypothetical protein